MQVPIDCCEDPVIHERITQNIKDWINNKVEQAGLAGTSESTGCKKKYYSDQSMYMTSCIVHLV